MEMQVVWADRGNPLGVEPGPGREESTALVALSRGGSVSMATPVASLWLVLRGDAEIECREGRFVLGAGQWLLLERDACPAVYAGAGALVLGVALGADLQAQLQQSAQVAVFPGRGEAGRGVRPLAFALWRRCAAFSRNEARLREVDRQAFAPVLRLLAGLQSGYRGLVDRCPGRSLRRKRQVFSRMQRARMYLEGNSHRVVRIGELAELTNFSSWYLSKTFQCLYEESPQSLSARLRLERAAMLLRDTDMMIGEVASASGFDNCCSFARAFRARFGASATQYRETPEALKPDSAKFKDGLRKTKAAVRT